MNLEHNLLRSNQSKQAGVSHELTLPASCELPKNTNETFWKTGPSWNLYFPVPNRSFSSVKAATLRSVYMTCHKNDNYTNFTFYSISRIFKLGNGNLTNEKCKDKDEDLITVTAYVFWKKRGKGWYTFISSGRQARRFLSKFNFKKVF